MAKKAFFLLQDSWFDIFIRIKFRPQYSLLQLTPTVITQRPSLTFSQCGRHGISLYFVMHKKSMQFFIKSNYSANEIMFVCTFSISEIRRRNFPTGNTKNPKEKQPRKNLRISERKLSNEN